MYIAGCQLGSKLRLLDVRLLVRCRSKRGGAFTRWSGTRVLGVDVPKLVLALLLARLIGRTQP